MQLNRVLVQHEEGPRFAPQHHIKLQQWCMSVIPGPGFGYKETLMSVIGDIKHLCLIFFSLRLQRVMGQENVQICTSSKLLVKIQEIRQMTWSSTCSSRRRPKVQFLESIQVAHNSLQKKALFSPPQATNTHTCTHTCISTYVYVCVYYIAHSQVPNLSS